MYVPSADHVFRLVECCVDLCRHCEFSVNPQCTVWRVSQFALSCSTWVGQLPCPRPVPGMGGTSEETQGLLLSRWCTSWHLIGKFL